jgi:DNA-binding NarL/FixJ family response regulator
MRLIIADDHPLVQEALVNVLAQAFPDASFTSCFTLGQVIEALAADAEIDLVLLDLDMPDSQGFAGLFQLLALYPTVAVAILSATSDRDTVRQAMEFGASGYVPKSLPMAGMAEAVAAILTGEAWVPEELGGARATAEGSDWARRFASLSAQQMRILMMVREGRLNKQIAGDLGIVEQTVKVHVSTILRKLKLSSRTQAAVAANRLIVHGGE